MSKDDLIPVTMRSKSEAKELSRKGGIASGKSRREKKQMKETLQELLCLPLEDKKLDELKELRDVKTKNITVQQAILIAQIQKALRGDDKAFNIIKDIMEDKNTIILK